MRAEGPSKGMMPRGMLLLSMVTFLRRRLGTAPGRPQSNISGPDAKGISRRKKSTLPNTAADAVRIAASSRALRGPSAAAHHARHFEATDLHVCVYAPVHATICMMNVPDHVNVGATSVHMHPCISCIHLSAFACMCRHAHVPHFHRAHIARRRCRPAPTLGSQHSRDTHKGWRLGKEAWDRNITYNLKQQSAHQHATLAVRCHDATRAREAVNPLPGAGPHRRCCCCAP